MAEAAQENTLQSILDQLRVANELDIGESVKTERIFGSIDKKLEDQAKDNKQDSKEQEEQTKQLGFMSSMLLAGKKLQEAAAKRAKLAGGKIKDFAGKQIDGIKKAAGNLLDLLKKG